MLSWVVPLLSALLAGDSVAGVQAGPPAAVRHVVVVLLDDVGVDCVAAYGEHPTAGPTPTLDAMAADGVLFRAAYAQPVCSPTRASMLTGLSPFHHGVGCVIPFGAEQSSPHGTFVASERLSWLPRLLSAQGILCDAIGKWHLTHRLVPDFHQHPCRVGFRRQVGHLADLGDWFGDPQDQGYWSWRKNSATSAGWSDEIVKTYATIDAMSEAFSSLADAASTAHPSFTWLALNAPHIPWDPPPPELFSGSFTGGPAKQAAILQAADELLGQLRAAYASAFPAESAATVWIVMGDNGTAEAAVEPPWPPDHNKGTVFEGGIRVPLIVCGPGVVPGECAAPVQASDLWATVLDLFHIPPPAGPSDSLSWAPALQAPQSFVGRGWAYARIHQPNGFGPYDFANRAVRRADGWKLRVETTGGTTQVHLNYLPDDPFEQVELYPPTTPQAAAALLDLRADLLEAET